MAQPADHSNPLTPLTTNVTLDVPGPWVLQVTTTTDTQFLAFIAEMPTGNPSMPNSIEIDIATGEAAAEVAVIEGISVRSTDAGGTQTRAAGWYIIPWKFTSGTKISARVTGIEGPGGVFNIVFQLIALETL